jgi:hypothetical protein
VPSVFFPLCCELPRDKGLGATAARYGPRAAAAEYKLRTAAKHHI